MWTCVFSGEIVMSKPTNQPTNQAILISYLNQPNPQKPWKCSWKFAMAKPPGWYTLWHLTSLFTKIFSNYHHSRTSVWSRALLGEKRPHSVASPSFVQSLSLVHSTWMGGMGLDSPKNIRQWYHIFFLNDKCICIHADLSRYIYVLYIITQISIYIYILYQSFLSLAYLRYFTWIRGRFGWLYFSDLWRMVSATWLPQDFNVCQGHCNIQFQSFLLQL